MSPDDWDERYRQHELVWGAGPNMWVEREITTLTPGHALDIACGEGRNSVWLAERGWTVTGVDFSPEALRKARMLANARLSHPTTIDFRNADVTAPHYREQFDLALLIYLQVPAPQRRAALTAAWAALAPGGTLLVIAHDSDNLQHGVGGPQDPDLLYTAEDIAADLTGTAPDARIEKCERALRPVQGHSTLAVDALLRARKTVHL